MSNGDGAPPAMSDLKAPTYKKPMSDGNGPIDEKFLV
jgi:hypothetical protein